jgi:hypothetical protein
MIYLLLFIPILVILTLSVLLGRICFRLQILKKMRDELNKIKKEFKDFLAEKCGELQKYKV